MARRQLKLVLVRESAVLFGNGTANTDITVGNDLVGGALFDGRSTLSATASSVGAAATATAGSSSGGVAGITLVDLTIGDNAGTIFGQATSTVTAAASTNGSITGAGNATASVVQDATGVVATTTTIGGDGNLTALSTLNGSATASNVGNVTSNDDNSFANLTLAGTGVNNAIGLGDLTTIGGSGSVIGQALVNGGSTAQSVNGAANGTADVTTLGLNLQNDASDITIGKSGSITGFAVTGGVTGSSLTDQVDLIASTTNGAANAGSSFDTTGILGNGTGTVLTAGPNGGSIFGTAIGGAKLIASTTEGAATTGIGDTAAFVASGATDIVGIQNANLIGGQVGINNISGTGFGKFDSAATAVKGNATGISNVNVNGILGDSGTNNTITTAGNVNAQATLVNTVVASTVTGAATATASSNAVGLSGFNVTIIGSGNLIAGANSSSITTASSNNGNASA